MSRRKPGKNDEEARATLEPRFLTLEDVARFLNVSVPQVYALVRSGDLPAIKIGGRGVWRVDRDKLEEYIERLTEETRQWALAHPLNPREEQIEQEGEQEAKGNKTAG